MSKAAKAVPVEEPKLSEKFYRIIEYKPKAGETFFAYQTEMIELQDGKIVSRSLVDKPNLFEYAQTHLIDCADPRNRVIPASTQEHV